VRCKKPAELLGSVPLVTSGRSPATKLFFTSLAVASEHSWTITAYRCTYPGHLELFDLSVVNASPPATGPGSAPEVPNMYLASSYRRERDPRPQLSGPNGQPAAGLLSIEIGR
jgi:hypothetical protein